MTVRIAGEPAVAEFLAVSAIGALTLVLHRSTALKTAARTAHAQGSMLPAGSETAFPFAN